MLSFLSALPSEEAAPESSEEANDRCSNWQEMEPDGGFLLQEIQNGHVLTVEKSSFIVPTQPQTRQNQPPVFSLTSSTTEKPGYPCNSIFLCRWIAVHLITVVILSTAVLVLSVTLTVIDLAGRRNKASEACSDPCADGWIWYRRECFLFSEDLGNWDMGQSFCASQNSSLAHIKTPQELDFMMWRKGPYDHWIGLRREPGRPWKWRDGSEFNNMFKILQDSDCVYLNDVAAKSAGCNTNRKWICSMPARACKDLHKHTSAAALLSSLSGLCVLLCLILTVSSAFLYQKHRNLRAALY